MNEIIIEANLLNIKEAINYASDKLDKYKCPTRNKVMAILTLEEVLALQIKNNINNNPITISINKAFNSINLKVTGIGNRVSKHDIKNNLYPNQQPDEETREVVDKLFDKLAGKSLNYKRINDTNIFEIKINKEIKTIYLTLGSLVIGILLGLLSKSFLPTNINDFLTNSLLSPIYTMFITVLKMVVGPLVFFSISSSIADLKDLRVFGRMALKIVSLYLLTSMLAISAGFISSTIFPIGNTGLQSIINNAASNTIEIASGINLSIKETVINIIPKNIIEPFIKGDMLQIIFLAICLGISSSVVGNDNYFGKFILDGNKVFSKFTSIIIKFMPIAIFCSMAKLTINMDIGNLLQVFIWIPGLYIGYAVMLVMYGILLKVFGKINPLHFFRKINQVILSAVSTCSSNATLPVTLKVCEDNLKISPKLFSFSIPLGATINMDGNCVMLVVSALFASKVFGISVNTSFIISLILVIISLSIGAPGVPGGGLVCLTILLPSIGIPQEFVSIIIGLYSINEMGQTLINVTGDCVVTYLVAKSERLLTSKH